MINKKNRGQAVIAMTVCLFIILGMMALILDTGRIYLEHAKLQRSVDAAVLAAAQDLPAEEGSQSLQSATEFGIKAAELNNVDMRKFDINFAAPTNSVNGKLNTVIATNETTVVTRLASILGYNEWTITSSASARAGAIAKINNWIPLGIIDDGQGVRLYNHYRLGNTTHTSANNDDIKLLYVPINYANVRQDVSNTISSVLSVGSNVNIHKTYDANDICKGIDDRIKNNIGVKGCFDVTEPIDLTKLNIIGSGSRKDWAYGDDPRLVYIPFVKVVDSNYLQITGFGLFYIEYAHFDPTPFGGTRPMTELVGYFVRSVIEGPVLDTTIDYGVVGVEYVDLNSLN